LIPTLCLARERGDKTARRNPVVAWCRQPVDNLQRLFDAPHVFVAAECRGACNAAGDQCAEAPFSRSWWGEIDCIRRRPCDDGVPEAPCCTTSSQSHGPVAFRGSVWRRSHGSISPRPWILPTTRLGRVPAIRQLCAHPKSVFMSFDLKSRW